MAKEAQLAFQAFTITKREGQDDFWLPIGAAFAHADGKGFNVVLQALPLGGKIVLRPPREESGERAPRDSRRDDRREDAEQQRSRPSRQRGQ